MGIILVIVDVQRSQMGNYQQSPQLSVISFDIMKNLLKSTIPRCVNMQSSPKDHRGDLSLCQNTWYGHVITIE